MHTIHWTAREWQLVEAAVPEKFDCNPPPRVLDAAQRVCLPAHRHRPRTALYGRIARAHYRGELLLARMRNREARAIADHQRLLAAEAAQRRLEKQHADLQRELAEIRARVEAMPKPERIVEIHTSAPRAPRVDIVGLVGQQVTFVRKHLPDNVSVRFVLADDAARLRDPAPAAILFARFISHTAEDKYAHSKVVRIYTRGAGAALPALDELLKEQP